MAVKRLEYHQSAVEDVRSAVNWYLEHSQKAALDLVEELRRAGDTILKSPGRWPAAPHQTRRFLLWRFPFSIIYSETDSSVVVWAVAHASRRPGFWRDRLK